MTTITDARDRLFTNADSIIDGFGGEFTFQQFLRRIMQDQKHAYIDLLGACKYADNPFDEAHQFIGGHLKRLTDRQGYTRHVQSGKDRNIFNNITDLVIYRKAE